MEFKTVLLFVQISAVIATADRFEIKYSVSNNFNKRIALKAFRTKPNETMVTSPLILKFPLCKLASVAKGEAKKELLASLGYHQENVISTCYEDCKAALTTISETDLTMFNKIFVNYPYQINPRFISNITDFYGVEFAKVGFDMPKAAVSFINRWADSVAFRRLPDILEPEDVNKNTSMVIVNGAHFKSSWETPFDVRNTKREKFRRLNGSISYLPMMTMTKELQYADNTVHDFKLATLYLSSWGVSMTFAVPNAVDGLPRLLEALERDSNLVKHTRNTAQFGFVKVTVPRFRIKSSIDWTELLKSVGIRRIFSDAYSGLEDMLAPSDKRKNIYLSKAKQKVFIEIDEFGLYRGDKHAGDNYDFPREMPFPGKTQEITADRPFLFTVNVQGGEAGGPGPGASSQGGPKVTTNELFVGVYYGPEYYLVY